MYGVERCCGSFLSLVATACRGSREPYVKLTLEQKAVIRRRVSEHGVRAAIRYFSNGFNDIELKETTVH